MKYVLMPPFNRLTDSIYYHASYMTTESGVNVNEKNIIILPISIIIFTSMAM